MAYHVHAFRHFKSLSRTFSMYICLCVPLPPPCHTRCIILHHIATHCNRLQHTTTSCNTMQHNATQCHAFAVCCLSAAVRGFEQVRHTQCSKFATHCNTLQHTATHCNTLQHTATHCNTLQHTAPQRHHYLDRLRALTLAHPGQSMFIYLWSHSTQNSLVLELYHQHHNYAQSRQILFEVLFFLTRSHASLHLNDIFKRHV